MGARANECQISPNYILQITFTFVFTILVKFATYFLGLPREIFFGVNTDD